MVLVRKYISISASHVVGYVGKPDKNTNLKLSKVDGARIGKLAVEAAFDKVYKVNLDLKGRSKCHGRVVNEISKVNGILEVILVCQYQKIYKIIALID